MKKIIGFITIVMMVLIGVIACDTEHSGSAEGNVSKTPTTIKGNENNSSSSQSGDDSSSSASDSSSSDDSSSSSQSGDNSSSSASDSLSSDDSSSSSQEPIIIQYTITVVIPTYQDIDNLLTYSDNTFTALSGYETYSWYIDRTKQSNSTSTLTPDTSSLSAGNHTVTVMVTDSHGGAYSAEMTFQVKKSY